MEAFCPVQPHPEHWQVVTFPNKELRQEFLEQVRLWNRVEGLPPIATEPMGDPFCLRLRQAERGYARILQLVTAYGGSLPR